MREKTPWAVICNGSPPEFPGHGKVFLTEEEYREQMMRPDSTWRCPLCGEYAWWDDDNYEEYINKMENGDD